MAGYRVTFFYNAILSRLFMILMENSSLVFRRFWQLTEVFSRPSQLFQKIHRGIFEKGERVDRFVEE